MIDHAGVVKFPRGKEHSKILRGSVCVLIQPTSNNTRGHKGKDIQV